MSVIVTLRFNTVCFVCDITSDRERERGRGGGVEKEREKD